MIVVRQADLADSKTMAVLRPVTADWAAPNTAMRRLEIAVGPEVEAQCRSLGELPVGTAVVTPAGNLTVEFLIHVVIRSVERPVSVSAIQRALRNGLRRASEWGVGSLALPPLGTGAGNLDAEESAEAMVPILLEYLRSDGAASRIEIVVDTDYDRDAFVGQLRRHGHEVLDPPANANPDAGSA